MTTSTMGRPKAPLLHRPRALDWAVHDCERTAAQLCRATGINPGLLSLARSGKKRLSVTQLEALSEAMGVPMELYVVDSVLEQVSA